jgi:hypothetical protein
VLGLLEDVGSSLARAYEHATLAVFGPGQTTTDHCKQWQWSEGIVYAWGVGEFSGEELEVGSHESVPTMGQVVAFDARDRFRARPIIGQGVVAVATVNKAWARHSSNLAELLRSAGFRLPRAAVLKDLADFQLLEQGGACQEGSTYELQTGVRRGNKLFFHSS